MTRRSGCKIYLVAGSVLLLAGIVALGSSKEACAQSARSSVDSQHSVRWMLRADGQRVDWPEKPPKAPLDSLQTVAQRTIRQLRRDGYYYASVDSATIESNRHSPQVELHVQRGPRIDLGRIRIEGEQVLSEASIRRIMDTEVDRPLDAGRLEADFDAVLERYEEKGYPLAQIRVQNVDVERRSPPALTLTLRIDEGKQLWLKRVEVPDGARTSPAFVTHVVPLERGDPLTSYEPSRVRSALRQTGLFRSVGEPEMRVQPDGGAVMFIPFEEQDPGSFDLVLGYLPPSGPRGSGQIVGNGHLRLRNVFGGGRRANFQLDRRPGQVSLFDVEVTDPYLFGRPIRLDAHFTGEQRDSTYSKRTLRLGGGYRFGGGWQATGTVSREGTDPGFAGTTLQDGRQRIARATAWFYGVGLRFEQVDDRVNPRRGGWLDVHLEQGKKERRLQRIVDTDTTTETETLRQERIRVAGRAYVPLFERHVLVLGGSGSALFSDEFDRSDLFRIGGASSLRGYDEDRFLGNVVGRFLAEYRVQIDPVSYAFVFTDVGFVRRPGTEFFDAEQGWHPGFGIGIQFSTALGIVDVTYALNTETPRPSDGKIHLGLSFGL